ncbi:MAG: patatin-like phospholipase family protein [Methylocystis sp.]|nr:patatin-like phospholipase family protein [Methylocystis sp.]MBI3274783.1 patatin-like phospholipase family protein [Methylocystis sp.]
MSYFLKTSDGSGGEGGLAAETGEPRPERPRIGLALGAGAARGWSHIGVLRELADHGIKPDVVAGTSIGAVVGGCYAAGRLDAIETFSRSLTKRRVFTLMDLSFSGMSLISGERLKASLEHELAGRQIEELPMAFAAVATEVGTGHEVWLQRGPMVLAVRASYALPGVFEPVRVGDRWLFDGALVNPIPVTVCRAMGAEFVIAVNVTADTMYRATIIRDHSAAAVPTEAGEAGPFAGRPRGPEDRLLPRYFERRAGDAPNVATAMIDAFNIIQDRILRSRLAGDPPDATINARLDAVGMFDFHKADELIAVGREATKRALPNIFAHIPLAGATP